VVSIGLNTVKSGGVGAGKDSSCFGEESTGSSVGSGLVEGLEGFGNKDSGITSGVCSIGCNDGEIKGSAFISEKSLSACVLTVSLIDVPRDLDFFCELVAWFLFLV